MSPRAARLVNRARHDIADALAHRNALFPGHARPVEGEARQRLRKQGPRAAGCCARDQRVVVSQQRSRWRNERLSSAMLRILLADDHEIVRRGLKELLEEQVGWTVPVPPIYRSGAAAGGGKGGTRSRAPGPAFDGQEVGALPSEENKSKETESAEAEVEGFRKTWGRSSWPPTPPGWRWCSRSQRDPTIRSSSPMTAFWR